MLRIVAVVRRGGGRSTWDAERLSFNLWGVDEEEVRETERRCPEILSRRARARVEAVVSGEGGSPKMKNLMKAPMRITTESWPRRKPSVKESLGLLAGGNFLGGKRRTRTVVEVVEAVEVHLEIR